MATMTLENLKKFVSVEEAAAIIGCTPGRVRQWLRSGELNGDKLNARAWAILRTDAEKLATIPQTRGRKRIGVDAN